MPRQAFEFQRQIKQPPDLRVRLVFGSKLGDAVERALQRPGIGWMIGDKLRQPVNMAIAHLEDAPGILEDRASL